MQQEIFLPSPPVPANNQHNQILCILPKIFYVYTRKIYIDTLFFFSLFTHMAVYFIHFLAYSFFSLCLLLSGNNVSWYLLTLSPPWLSLLAFPPLPFLIPQMYLLCASLCQIHISPVTDELYCVTPMFSIQSCLFICTPPNYVIYTRLFGTEFSIAPRIIKNVRDIFS